jgi:hypothetical protein
MIRHPSQIVGYRTHFESDQANDNAKSKEDDGDDQPYEAPNYNGVSSQTVCALIKLGPREGQHPQTWANSDASEVFTFLASVSSVQQLRDVFKLERKMIATDLSRPKLRTCRT